MRWIYYDQTNSAEVAEHERVSQRITDWWAEFQRSTKQLDALFRGAEEFDLPEWMHQHLQAIHPDIMWEFGPAVNQKGHRLVITPESHSELRPLVEDIVARVPRIKGWEFYTYRLPEPVEQALPTVEGRTGMDIKDVRVAVAIGEHNRVDLTFQWDETPTDDEQAFNAAFVATETLVGEEMLDRWVGVINMVDQSAEVEAGQRFLPLDRLKPTFDAVVNSAKEQLPAEPYYAFAPDGQWALLKLEPQEAADYSDRDDMMTCVTCNPDLVGATFSNAPFYSERYSRCGETFCYVKIDGADAEEMGFQDREDMEEAVRNVLEPQELGGLVGSGTGLRYSYIELALTDRERGIAVVRRAMQEGTVPRRSWILFHDADLAPEWIGVYEDSPPPPTAGT